MEVRSPENSKSYREAFDNAHNDSEVVRQLAETFMERFHEPEADEEPDYQALAAANKRERADCIRDLEDELANAEGDLEKAPTSALWTHV